MSVCSHARPLVCVSVCKDGPPIHKDPFFFCLFVYVFVYSICPLRSIWRVRAGLHANSDDLFLSRPLVVQQRVRRVPSASAGASPLNFHARPDKFFRMIKLHSSDVSDTVCSCCRSARVSRLSAFSTVKSLSWTPPMTPADSWRSSAHVRVTRPKCSNPDKLERTQTFNFINCKKCADLHI